jgi:hypothetical protein
MGEDDGVSKKPPRALAADPGHPRRMRYYGTYILWWDDGDWEWIKCVNCGAELTSLESRERGCGPTCAQVVTEAAKGAILCEERRNAEAYLEEKKNPRTRRRPTRARSTTRSQDDERSQVKSAPRKSKAKGITNDQAKELAQLQKAAGERYSGSGMTESMAHAEIQRLKRQLGR